MLLIERIAFIFVMKLLLVLIFTARTRQAVAQLPTMQKTKQTLNNTKTRVVAQADTQEVVYYGEQRDVSQIIQFDCGIVLFVDGSSITSAQQDEREVLL